MAVRTDPSKFKGADMRTVRIGIPTTRCQGNDLSGFRRMANSRKLRGATSLRPRARGTGVALSAARNDANRTSAKPRLGVRR